MKTAVLAWGSLVWDRQELSVRAEFKCIGPCLPIEFSRVSGDGRLTLVINEKAGVPCATYAAVSSFDDLDAAKENLRQREGMDHVNGVGFVDLVAGKQSQRAQVRHPAALQIIAEWTRANSFDATIWTALGSNFHETQKAGEPFSTNAAIHYLAKLDARKLATALRYIRCAPQEVQTPVRTAVSARWPI